MKSKQELIEEWESAIEAAEFYGKGKEERLISYMKDFVSDLKQLDEPEILSQEFINEKAVEVYADTADAEVHAVFRMRDLQNLLVPKQELAVVPQEVAAWYENHKDSLEKQLQGIAYNLDRYGRMPEVSDLDKWINETECPVQTLASLEFGYEVEEREQKYYVMNNDNGLMLIRMMDGKTITEAMTFFRFEDMSEVEKKSHRFTEQEIKGYDERYWAFRKPVVELEERNPIPTINASDPFGAYPIGDLIDKYFSPSI